MDWQFEDRAWLALLDPPARAGLDMSLSSYRSLMQPIHYVSIPITTGPRYYKVLEANSVRSVDELMKRDAAALARDIIEPNITDGVVLAERVAQSSPQQVVCPGIFVGKNWDYSANKARNWLQQQYQFLWNRVIEEKASAMTMKDGWSYSNGCAQEFTRAMLMQWGFVNPTYGMLSFPQEKRTQAEQIRASKMIIMDESGERIDLANGMHALTGAVASLHLRGFDASTQVKCLDLLDNILFTCYHDHMSKAVGAERYSMEQVRDLRRLKSICERTQQKGDYAHIPDALILQLFSDEKFAKSALLNQRTYRTVPASAPCFW